MRKYKLLDLFCGAGGCSMGYHQAGFEVEGVDNKPQKNYPFKFHMADALTFPVEGFDVIHASPPCQAYSRASVRYKNEGKKYPDLISKTRLKLKQSRIPYIIENVKNSPLINGIMLCGTSFELRTKEFELQRHRYFESSIPLFSHPCQHTNRLTLGVYGNGTQSWLRNKIKRNVLVPEMREIMQIDWMIRNELNQAIPPAYTKWIGEQIINKL